MGMYSWRCNGCGHELAMGEQVVLDGQSQSYNGHGGSAAAHSKYDPAAWHARCYSRVTAEEQADTTPSSSAPNQGFGPAKLEFQAKYDPQARTEYTVAVLAYDDNTNRDYHFWYTDGDTLEDQAEYTRRVKALIAADDPITEEPGMSEEDYQRRVEERSRINQVLAGVAPERRAKTFERLGDASHAAASRLAEVLPQACDGVYQVQVYGQQGKCRGLVYEYVTERDETGSIRRKTTYYIGQDSADNLEVKLLRAIKQYNAAQTTMRAATAAINRAVEVCWRPEHANVLEKHKDRLPEKWQRALKTTR